MNTYYAEPRRKISSKFRLSSFLKGAKNEKDSSFNLPDFENVKIEIVKTARGEIKEKPVALINELKNLESGEVSQLNLNLKNSRMLKKLINKNPQNFNEKIHRNTSKKIFPRRERQLQTSSVLDILGTVESPSHWRFFENKKRGSSRMLSPQNIITKNNSKKLALMNQRHFSPEITTKSFNNFENKFPFNVEKIFRKHAEQEEKRQIIRYSSIHNILAWL